MKTEVRANEYVLGLDVGANSIGWALLTRNNAGPVGLVKSGVRVFAAGVEGDIASGKDESRAKKRREARLRRRMLERTRRRLSKLASLLQQAGLLPPGYLESAKERENFFSQLDCSLFAQEARKADPHVLPYRLRARALDKKLTPYELGRALYHLAQRRGFLSTRRAGAKAKEKEEGEIKQEIGKLAENIKNSGARTLGEYLAGLDPTKEEEHIRRRWTSRQMYVDEFERIWAAQTSYYPDILTDEFKKEISRSIFFQRPLKVQRHLIGQCSLEPRCKRAPLAILAAQRFRMLQKVNDLELITADGEVRKLTPQVRTALVNALEIKGDLKWKEICKLLRLDGCHFNFEKTEEGLIGNRTAAKLAKAFGDRWTGFSIEQKERLVEDVRSIQKPETLKRRGVKAWGLDEQSAKKLAEVRLEAGYCNLSRKALGKVLPLMEQGIQFATARRQLYGAERPAAPSNFLPPLSKTVDVRNPAVERALTELRRVVNGIIREHGKPALIRVELARDLKKPRKDRKRIAAQNLQNRRARENAKARILKEAGITTPSRADIEKYLLAEECGWCCPYTGKQISMSTLFGETPQFDVEHIIPFHRCLDNSFINKTLCEIEENRKRKGNRTPWEAYGSDPEKWREIIVRVKKFQGKARDAKLTQFQVDSPQGKPLEELDDFISRQLNDTRYASRLAVTFLGRLYGAAADGIDTQGTRRIQPTRGQVTGHLRGGWRLNTILGGGEKMRDDHRQHAIDAVVVALTGPGTIKALSDAARRGWFQRGQRLAELPAPWDGFSDDVSRQIENLIVSHRVSRKVSGAMHEETIYSKPHTDPEGQPCVHVRKPLAGAPSGLSKHDLENIVDPVIKETVKKKLQDLGMDDPQRAFSNPENHPTLKAKEGRQIPIHSARLRVNVTTTTIGEGARQRQVKLGSNHHMEILETKDKKGQPRWEGLVVSTYEAMQRLKAGQPIVRRDHGEGKEFKFSLAGGEIIEINDGQDNKRGLYVIRTITKSGQGRREYAGVEFVSINDARKKEDIKKAKEWKTASPDSLREKNCRKVVITPLGEVRKAND